MKLCVAEKDKKISVQRVKPTASADNSGFIDLTNDANWEEYEAAFASVKTRGGREFWKVDIVSADVSQVWVCDYSTKMAAATPKMRLKSEDVVYNIASVIDVDLAHETIEIQTTKAV